MPKPRRHLDCLPPEPRLGRRAALGLFATAAATATLAAACSSTTTVVSNGGGDAGGDDASGGDDGSAGDGAAACTPTGKDHGAVTSFPQGKWIASSGVVIGHDAQGLFAYTMICTHQGCTIGAPNATTGTTTCPCHGAEFDGNGAVLRGPASRPLQHYALEVCDGRVYVDTKTVVSASTRTPAA